MADIVIYEGDGTGDYNLVHTVSHCARCGQDHDNLVYRPFKYPVECDGVLFPYWAECPISHDPIFMRFYKEDDDPQ